MAVTFAFLHIAGTIPVSIDVLKMVCKRGARASASSFNIRDVPGLLQEISRDLMS